MEEANGLARMDISHDEEVVVDTNHGILPAKVIQNIEKP
jgi:hypothetical protein